MLAFLCGNPNCSTSSHHRPPPWSLSPSNPTTLLMPLHRIVRDYEKYIARQFKRGTSRQELNVSWLKKNELDLKRHVTELRDSIRNNWTTTGQELSKELKQFWANNGALTPLRPSSPAPGASSTPLKRLSRLDVPGRMESPGSSAAAARASSDFAAGYSLGLIGGVRSWVCSSSFFAIITFLSFPFPTFHCSPPLHHLQREPIPSTQVLTQKPDDPLPPFPPRFPTGQSQRRHQQRRRRPSTQPQESNHTRSRRRRSWCRARQGQTEGSKPESADCGGDGDGDGWCVK